MNEKKFWKRLVKYMELGTYKSDEINTVKKGRIVTTDTDVWDVTITAKRKGRLRKEFELLGNDDKKVEE